MMFKVKINDHGKVYLQLNTTSCFSFISSSGLELNSTMSKQAGVDYDTRSRPKVTGVDLV